MTESKNILTNLHISHLRLKINEMYIFKLFCKHVYRRNSAVTYRRDEKKRSQLLSIFGIRYHLTDKCATWWINRNPFGMTTLLRLRKKQMCRYSWYTIRNIVFFHSKMCYRLKFSLSSFAFYFQVHFFLWILFFT